MEKIRVGIVGAGSFSNHFIPLFQAHPMVEDVVLSERIDARRRYSVEKYGIERSCESFEELVESDVDAIAIYTQRWTHAPTAVEALRAGKDVFSAVPAAITLEELEALVAAVESSGRIYMLGETSYYEPATIFCRKRFRQGLFGRFVFAEAGYHHDMEHGFYPPYQGSNGPEWKKFASFPPMLYPTHSVGKILGVTGGRATRAACFGQVDRHPDGIFKKDMSFFGNDFSNEAALFRTQDGAMFVAREFRRISGPRPFHVYGTAATFGNGTWITHDKVVTDVTEELTCAKHGRRDDWEAMRRQGAQEDFYSGLAPAHDAHRLPEEFRGQPNGHGGSHQFLADDFVKACVWRRLPPLHVWNAAKFCAPGIVAHQSAVRGGESLPVPDFGDPPADADIMDLELEGVTAS